MKKFKVISICKGNANRSPLVQYTLEKMLEEHPELNISVSSAGLLDWGINPRDPIMCKVASDLGITMRGATRYVDADALQEADCIITFSRSLKDSITRILPYSNWARITLFDKLAFNQDTDVEDPRDLSEAVYFNVANHIIDGCRNIVRGWVDNPPCPLS